MKSYLSSVHKAFDEKYTSFELCDTVSLTDSDRLKAFFDEQLKAFVGQVDAIIYSSRNELVVREQWEKFRTEGMESEEAES